jgi:hypothetical protein
VKSGRHIFQGLSQGCGDPEKIRALPNGELRSLLRYIHKHDYHHTDSGGIILGLCMVEATERFLKKGKGKGL